MTEITLSAEEQLLQDLNKARKDPASGPFRQQKILNSLDLLLRTEGGLVFIYDHMEEIVASGFFKGTVWEHPKDLQPALVKGTLCNGFPMVIYESINELRMLGLALERITSREISAEEAMQFVEEAMISCFDLAFHEGGEETRYRLTPDGLERIKDLFQFILSHVPIDNFKEDILREIREVTGQRPIMTNKIEDLIRLISQKYTLDENRDSDSELKLFVDALLHPSSLSVEYPDLAAYKTALGKLTGEQLSEECRQVVYKMSSTGLVSEHHLALISFLAGQHTQLLPQALGLNEHGHADYKRHEEFVLQLIRDYLVPGNKSVIYGLSKFLNRTLLSRKAVLNSIKVLMHAKIHPNVEKRLLDAQPQNSSLSARQLIMGGIIRMLGQPLGVGQGMNPTCQSARGLSMWSTHSPSKIIDYLITAVAADALEFRFHAELINSQHHSVSHQFDYELDPVSIVLVPLLDSIYKQMMQKAQFRFPNLDPHVTVNPAFYGHWIPTGFLSCYDQTLNQIVDYRNFVRTFYSAFHPLYNGGFELLYPIPLGIFVTTAKAEFLGFHAVSLLRVDQSPSGEVRAYFFNPNNDGRQNWGQDIRPEVMGHGERYGESSLPFHQFASRVYAYHFNSVELASNRKTERRFEMK